MASPAQGDPVSKSGLIEISIGCPKSDPRACIDTFPIVSGCLRLEHMVYRPMFFSSACLCWQQSYPGWRHQMETFSALIALCAGNSPVTDEFPAQRPVTRSFVVFFDLSLNKRLSKQSGGWWFEMQSRPLWRHCNVKEVPYYHDDVIKWKHFPRCWSIVRGIHRSPVDSLHKGQWRRVFVFSLIRDWTNGWANNRDASDLKPHRVHYDVTVTISLLSVRRIYLTCGFSIYRPMIRKRL